MRKPTRSEWVNWNDLIAGAPGGHSFWQLTEFADHKLPEWRPRPIIHDTSAGPVAVLYLVRRIPLHGEFWYAPMGPCVREAQHLREICDELRRESGAFTVVLEPLVDVSSAEDEARIVASIPGLRKIDDIQPDAHTVVLNLEQSEEELLASFKQRTRRSIRKAEKNGAIIEHIDDESAFEPFWKLYEAMAQRADLLGVRPREYYESRWRLWLAAGKGHFVLAKPNADMDYAAGAFLWHDKQFVAYKDGGSLRIPEANGLQYLVQWEAIRWAKAHDATQYDLVGMPPSWELDDPNHFMHGLVQFKTGFGNVIDRLGAVQLDLRPRSTYFFERGTRRAISLVERRRGATFF